jgi:hypothetical protein
LPSRFALASAACRKSHKQLSSEHRFDDGLARQGAAKLLLLHRVPPKERTLENMRLPRHAVRHGGPRLVVRPLA